VINRTIVKKLFHANSFSFSTGSTTGVQFLARTKMFLFATT